MDVLARSVNELSDKIFGKDKEIDELRADNVKLSERLATIAQFDK
jgi:hypothetical protein